MNLRYCTRTFVAYQISDWNVACLSSSMHYIGLYWGFLECVKLFIPPELIERFSDFRNKLCLADVEWHTDDNANVKVETGRRIPTLVDICFQKPEVVISQPCSQVFRRNLVGMYTSTSVIERHHEKHTGSRIVMPWPPSWKMDMTLYLCSSWSDLDKI